jgi:hypothetical protein
VALPPVDCVVITLNIPQELPLQPGPLKAQVSTVLGFEPGTGVSVATIVAVPLTGTLEGAETCNEKLLVMVMAADTCFEASAALCAVSVTLAAEGRIWGRRVITGGVHAAAAAWTRGTRDTPTNRRIRMAAAGQRHMESLGRAQFDARWIWRQRQRDVTRNGQAGRTGF